MAGVEDLNCEQLIEEFESLRLPSSEFGHREHVKLGFAYLRKHELLDAMRAFRAALRNYADHHRAHGLYNETITIALLLILNDRMESSGADDFETFADANPDLLVWRPSVLDRYYKAETLRSPRARRTFIWPDAV